MADMNQNSIYIIPPKVLFNPEFVKPFQKINVQDTIFLLNTLYLNLLENIFSNDLKSDIYCFFDSKDKDFITEEYSAHNISLIYFDVNDPKSFFDIISDKKFSNYKNSLIAFSDLIGLSNKSFEQYINLLSVDESLLLGKSKHNTLALFGFNRLPEKFIAEIVKLKFNFDNIMAEIESSDYFLHITKDLFRVTSVNDFKELYFILSNKQSIEYCSQEMHERFTHLFIEYKDLIK